MLFQRHRMDAPPHARSTVATAGGRGGFSGISGRRRADNDPGVHRNIHAVTAVTASAVTADNVSAVTSAAVTAVTAAAVTDVTAATVAAGSVTVVTAAAITAVTTATATVVSVAVLGDAAGVWS